MNNPEFTNIIKVPRFEKKNGFYTNPERSALMAKIKGRSTKPEVILRKELWSMGFRYKLQVKNLPGKPDILILKYNIIVFVDGEFWHGYHWDVKKDKIKANRDFGFLKLSETCKGMLKVISS
jgi:DNA mismatch endonuclease (patch repair protein)